MSNDTQWLKINQERSSEAQWKVWRKANRLWSSTKGRMLQPLGRWLRENDTRRIKCFAYVRGRQLALRSQDEFQVYNVDGNGRQIGAQHERGIRYSDLHPEAHPAEVYESPDGMWTVKMVTSLVEPDARPVYETFHGYTQTLLPWEADILQNVKLELEPAYICLDLQLYFYAGTDGSVKHGIHGSFGSSLSNPEGDRVATAMGPVRGAQLDSYRAECTGMLSLLRFLMRIAQYTSMEGPWRGLIGTDSQSLLDKVYEDSGTESNKRFAALDVLDAEWDLLVEIQDALKEMPGVYLIYVKGHQDDRMAYERLPLMAQLNVDAVRLAGTYNKEHDACRPFALMTPNTGAMLITDDGILTSKFKDKLRTRSTGPSLAEYIRSKNQWDHCTFDAVNWAAHGKAMKSRLPKRVHHTKFLHEALPTYHHLNNMDGGNRRCIGCGTCDETTDHIFRCSAPSRENWRATWWAKLDAFHSEHGTHPLLRYVLREAITQWFQPGAPEKLSTIVFPQEVRNLIQQQNAIGWRQIFRGRFSGKWQRLQNAYYFRHNKKKSAFKRTGERWQKTLVLVIWDSWFDLWSIRNGEIHGTTRSTRAEAERREVVRQLTELYAARQFMEPQVQEMLDEDQETQLQRPIGVTKNWLVVAGPVIRRNVRKVRKATLQGVRSLRSYFPRRTADG